MTNHFSDPPSPTYTLQIENFAHLRRVRVEFADLTVLVGPQGAGKSLALQWLKVALDGKQVVDALRSAGQMTERPDVLTDLIFGIGMASAWHDGESEVRFNADKITPKSIGKIGDGTERLFFIPAHRSLLISDGWAAPFQKLGTDTPAVARLFSQALFDRFSRKDTGTLFPVTRTLKVELRREIDSAIFHGGQVRIAEDHHHARRLRLVHGAMQLPFMTWTAGQREFTPMLLGLYHLLPSAKFTKVPETDWVVIEEPEMGLHPKAITATLLLVLDLMWRGYRVVLSTHSPHVLTMVWMLRHLQTAGASWKRVCEGFGLPAEQSLRAMAESALQKEYRVTSLGFDGEGKVVSKDISSLDPGDEDDEVSGWGGLTEYSSRFGEAVRAAVLEAEG